MTLVIARTQIERLHAWPSCPHEEVAYLRSSHRHVFHITAKKKVEGHDREIEFIMLKHQIEAFVKELPFNLGSASCEDLASLLVGKFQLHSCEVSEDGENGAEVFA
jgi:hypothetical protein